MASFQSASHKRRLRSLTLWPLILMAVVAGILLPGSHSWAQTPLRIAYTDFPPFHSRPDGEALEGIFFEVITEAVEKRMGTPLKWSAYPWKRCQQSVRSGIDDALLTVPTAERLSYTASHPKPFYQKRMHIFTQTDHPRMELLKGLKTLTEIRDNDLSTITYGGNSWHNTHVASLGIITHETNPVDNVWRMLAARRGDLVIEWPHGAWPAIRHLGLEQKLVDTGVSMAAMSFHLLIRKGSSHLALLAGFDAVIEAMREDGTMKAILAPFQGD